MCHQLSVNLNNVDTCAIIFDTQHIESKGIIRTLPSDFSKTGPSTIKTLSKLFMSIHIRNQRDATWQYVY
jgi:hypothetical protein